ncbi:hypothetical protein [Rhodobacteraceae bacterium DSL-40]|uniref:hypothetical protein n=1 Tax=Amaricoccus sp. B4 TaxID=3368557 RepID=UPI000DAB43B1
MDRSSTQALAHEPTLAELMDPEALARRLEEARARRAVALAARAEKAAREAGAEPLSKAQPAAALAEPDRPQAASMPSVPFERLVRHLPARERGSVAAAPPQPHLPRAIRPVPLRGRRAAQRPRLAAAAAILLLAFGGAGFFALRLGSPPPEPWMAAAAPRTPAFASDDPGLPTATAAAGRFAIPVAAVGPPPLAPRARPDDFVPIRAAAGASQGTARGAARASDLGTAMREMNADTIGAAAQALGIRKRVVLPDGTVLSLDRRGLRLRPGRGNSGRR